MSETTTVEAVNSSVKLLSVGRAWINDRQNERGTSPSITLKLDRELGINITLGPESQILLFQNRKRDEVNPTTGKPFQDADYRIAIQLPAEAVDKEIARQQAVREASKATPTTAPIATPVTPA